VIRTQIQLTERQAALIRQVAAERHTSMAEAIRQGIDHFLQCTVTVDREARVRRALAVSGRFRSGHQDTSAAHDGVLAEAFRP
jgi:hypothetical protein